MLYNGGTYQISQGGGTVVGEWSGNQTTMLLSIFVDFSMIIWTLSRKYLL